MSRANQPVVHRGVSLLVVEAPEVLDEIRLVVELDEYVLARVSETEFVIDPVRVGELSAKLSKAGMAPLVRRSRQPGT